MTNRAMPYHTKISIHFNCNHREQCHDNQILQYFILCIFSIGCSKCVPNLKLLYWKLLKLGIYEHDICTLGSMLKCGKGKFGLEAHN